MQDHVSIYGWIKNAGAEFRQVASEEIPAGNLDVRRYEEAVRNLVGSAAARKVDIVWMFLFTPMEYVGSPGKMEGMRVAPSWMEDCWKSLPLCLMPSATYSGLDCIGRRLRSLDHLDSKGTGVYFELLGKGAFIGMGDEKDFMRISRVAAGDGQQTGLNGDWCQQTRMLFKSHTGLELKQIIQPWSVDGKYSGKGQGQLESMPCLSSLSCPNSMANPVFSPLQFVHLCLLEAAERNDCPQLEDPVRSYRLRQQSTTALKTGIYILVCGWLLMLSGACQNYNQRAGRDEELLEKWSEEKELWEQSNKIYRKHLASANEADAPFRLIALVAGKIPPGLDIERFHVREQVSDFHRTHAFTLEGRFEDVEPDQAFRGWIGSFKEQLNSKDEQLKLLPDDGGLRFRFDCEVPITGGLQ
jgi:hypothetical protein